MAKEYILSDITCRNGRLNQSLIYDLTFIDLELQVYVMIVDTSYRNYSKWQHIIDTESFGAYTGLRRTNAINQDRLPVLDADFPGQLVTHLTQRDIEDIIHHLQEQL